eukprot:CFRG2518T1
MSNDPETCPSPARIILIGSPGSGKGSYAKELVPAIHVSHLSPGDLLRSEISSGTSLGKEVRKLVASGELVPDDIVAKVMKNALAQCESGFILDGYPRNVNQAKLLESMTDIDLILHVRMREDALKAKLEGRRVCAECGVSFNIAEVKYHNSDGHCHDTPIFYMPAMLPSKPECIQNRCVDQLELRMDDTPDVVLNRLVVYKNETEPLIDYYTRKGVKIVEIDIEGGKDVMLPVFRRAVGI